MKDIVSEIRDFNAEYTKLTGKKPPPVADALLFVCGAFMFPELANNTLNKNTNESKAIERTARQM